MHPALKTAVFENSSSTVPVTMSRYLYFHIRYSLQMFGERRWDLGYFNVDR